MSATVQTLLAKKGHAVHTIELDKSVLDAARLMNQHRIGAVVVTRGDKVVGIFTERDILCRIVAEQRDAADVEVSAVMTSPVACCAPDTELDECRAVMRSRRLRHLPVVDDGHLVGMISIGDLNDAAAEEQDKTIQYLYEYMVGEWG